MELSDDLIYTAMQRLAVIQYQKILFADLTEDLYFVLKANATEWNLMISEANSRKLSKWVEYFSTCDLLHEADRKHFQTFVNTENLRKTFEENHNQPLRIKYRRRFSEDDVEFHAVKLELIPDIDKNGHLICFMFVKEITEDDRIYRASLQTIKENKKLIRHATATGKRKILLVEDNEMNRAILINMLQDEYEVIEAQNGLLGLEILADRYREISAVFLDLYMPIVSGFEFLEKINRDSILSAVPIIVTTGSTNPGDEAKCLKLGASDFISKPYDPQVVKMRLEAIIKLKESASTLSAIEYDSMTGLYTRAAFYHLVEETIHLNPHVKYDLVIATINNFRSIIEQYGDNIGKQVVSIAGKKLRSKATNGTIIARLRDEVFAIFKVNSDIKYYEDFPASAAKLLEEESPVNCVTAKFAVYQNIDHSVPVATLIERTMSAIESIKLKYDNDLVFYDEKLILQQEKEAEMENSFERAVANDEFEIWFQPKYCAITKRITGAEALVRWRGGNGQLIPPMEFIPLFEKDGLIRTLDEYIFYKVCQFQHERKIRGLKLIPISVNLSRASMYNYDIARKYETITRNFGITTDLIPIEITESATVNSNSVRVFADALNDMGFKLHMDDFGSGYSSLSSLQILHFDTIKLDKSLIDFIGTSGGESLIRHTIAYAKESDLNVVAEGVENEEQFKFLQKSGCDTIQGFLFSPPVSKEKFQSLI